MSGKVITLLNLKGGVGKTTSVLAFSGALAQQGARVLMIDLDPQSSLSLYVGLSHSISQFQGSSENPKPAQSKATSLQKNHPGFNPYERTIYDCITLQEKPTGSVCAAQAIYSSGVKGLDLMPASCDLFTLESEWNNVEACGTGDKLTTLLQPIRDGYDFIFLDTPPAFGVLMFNGILAANSIIIPVQTDMLALRALSFMQNSLSKNEQLKHAMDSAYILPTLYDQRLQSCKKTLKTLRERFNHVSGIPIPVDARIKEASRQGFLPHLWGAESQAVRAYEKYLRQNLGASVYSRNKKPIYAVGVE